MKKAFVKWLIEKVFKAEIVEIKIPYKIEYKHYLPKDGEWHHIGQTVDFWIREGKVLTKDQANYLDGNKISEVKIWSTVKKISPKDVVVTGKEKSLQAYFRL